MQGRLRVLLLAAVLAAPTPLLAQGSVVGDTVWVPAPSGAVGRLITVAFTDPADRAAMLRDELTLPTVDGRAWRTQDLVVTLDVGTRAADVTWRVVGPAAVIDAFEAEVRKQSAKRPSARPVTTRSLVVR